MIKGGSTRKPDCSSSPGKTTQHLRAFDSGLGFGFPEVSKLFVVGVWKSRDRNLSYSAPVASGGRPHSKSQR